MADSQDIIDIDGLRPSDEREGTGPRTPFLSIWFRCCHAYGRMYRNRDETAYVGRCPRCGGRVQALIGPESSPARARVGLLAGGALAVVALAAGSVQVHHVARLAGHLCHL